MSPVIVGVDASERAADAVALAERLAHAGGQTLIVASVFPYADVPSAANREYRDAAEAEAKRVAREVVRSLTEFGAGLRTATVASESPARGLQDLAIAEDASLIVLGSSHIGRLGRVHPGSTAERLLHGAPCPVAVAPSGYAHARPRLRRIGAAWDGSDEAAAALDYATHLARRLGAELRLIRVADVLGYGTPAMMGGPYYVRTRESLEHRLAQELRAAVAALPDDVSAEPRLLVGDPVAELGDQTRTLDLLVTGSRGYGPVRAVMLGATSARLMRTAHCPVVVVPRGAADRSARVAAAT